MKNQKIERILAISKKLGLAHIGSNISVLPILEDIYSKKKATDRVGLSGAHAHLAHLLFLYEEDFVIEGVIEKYGIHCDRKAGCDITGGSLGHTGIALGMALANRKRNVYWIETDGSCQEGSVFEALRIKTELKLFNLKIIVNLNGYTAVAKIDRDELSRRLKMFCPDIDIRYTNNSKDFDSIEGHYKKL